MTALAALCRTSDAFIRGVFNSDEKRYARTANLPLQYPTNDTRDLIQAAMPGVQAT